MSLFYVLKHCRYAKLKDGICVERAAHNSHHYLNPLYLSEVTGTTTPYLKISS
jgi:hypothetical protein